MNVLGGQCEPITTPLCKTIHYNMTQFPNILGHETQTDAGIDIQTYHPLVKINCSPSLRLFLCSLYLPVCSAGPIKPPCRSLCVKARSGCEQLMVRFGHEWPDHMSCDRFPESPNPNVCINSPSEYLLVEHSVSSQPTAALSTRTPGWW